MDEQTILKIRRKLLSLKTGETGSIKLPGSDIAAATAEAIKFARSRRMKITCAATADGIAFTYEGEASRYRYSLETLHKPGDSLLVAVSPNEEQTVRVKASQYARSRGFASSVSREGPGQLRVTLIDPAARKAVPVPAAPTARPPKPLRYGLHELAKGESVFVPLTEEPFAANLRSYCRYHGLYLGAVFKVQYEQGETPIESGHRITCLDRGTGLPPPEPRQSKYPFASLEVGDSVLVKVPPTDHQIVRGSASAWARRYGWKFSCRAEPGGIRVTREQ